MRLVVGVLALTLYAPFAGAEGRPESPAGASRPADGAGSDASSTPDAARSDPGRNKIPLRVVRAMPESRQALLFDRSRSTHVLAELGGKVDGYTVDDIDDDQVTLSRNGIQIVLAAPARARGRDGERVHIRTASAAPRTDAQRADTLHGEPTPVDPYGAQPERYAAPVDPYDDAAIRVVEAPAATRDPRPSRAIEPGEGGVRVVQAPGGSSPSASRPIEPGADGVRVVQAPGSPAQPAAAAAPSGGTGDATATREPSSPIESPVADHRAGPAAGNGVVLARGEVDSALADFARLTTAVHATLTASGVLIDGVGDRTIFQRAGLRAGDVVTAVDGAPLRSLDDAADLYARASSAKAFTAQIVRNGKPVTLHVTIQ